MGRLVGVGASWTLGLSPVLTSGPVNKSSHRQYPAKSECHPHAHKTPGTGTEMWIQVVGTGGKVLLIHVGGFKV